MAQLSYRAVVKTTLMGAALSPGHLLGVDIAGLTLISRGCTLTQYRLVTALELLTRADPPHIKGVALTGPDRSNMHHPSP